MKLHLGCGKKLLPGFTNVDMPGNAYAVRPDVECDLSKRLPFEDESADEIHAYHVIEHFYRPDLDGIIKDWARVLRPGGLMVLELPCLDNIILIFNHYLKTGKPIDQRITLWGLYGEPYFKTPEMLHKWCYTKAELKDIMRAAGLSVTYKHPQTHVAFRDMRAEGVK